MPADGRASLATYRWSSHRAYLGQDRPPPWLCTEWLSFFAGRRALALRHYARFIAAAFGTVVPDPWENLQMGLVLGSEALIGRVKKLLGTKGGKEELRWVSRAEGPAPARPAAAGLLLAEPDRRWQVWIRVRLGGERRIDVARDLDYRDGSAITQILKRREQSATSDPALRQKMAALRAAFTGRLSSIKR